MQATTNITKQNNQARAIIAQNTTKLTSDKKRDYNIKPKNIANMIGVCAQVDFVDPSKIS